MLGCKEYFHQIDLISITNMLQICHTSRKSTNTINLFLVSPPNTISFLGDQCHYHKKGGKGLTIGKIEVRCGGLWWTQSGNILFVSCLYIGVTIESTCKPLKFRFVSVCLHPYQKSPPFQSVTDIQEKIYTENAFFQYRITNFMWT